MIHQPRCPECRWRLSFDAVVGQGIGEGAPPVWWVARCLNPNCPRQVVTPDQAGLPLEAMTELTTSTSNV